MSKPETAKKARITDTPGARRGITRRDFLYFSSFGAAMTALSGPLSAFAESAADDDAQGQSVDEPRGEIAGHFLHAATYKPIATLVDGQIQEEFYFNENFFANSAMLFNPHLCSLAMALTIAACPSSHDYDDKFSNAVLFFEELDCDKGVFVVNDDYRKKPETDTIGLVCSHRTIQVPNEDDEYEDCNLVFLSIRGESYGLEWASNLKAGSSGNHQGFTEASDKAIAFLRAYIKNAQLEGRTKFLLSGFSRAAATINLTAGRLIDEAIDAGADYDEETGYDLSGVFGDAEIETYQSDLYTYCFEPPAAVLADTDAKRQSAYEDHKNIFNIVNPCDIVPLVMPSKFQFLRYGADVKLPAPTDGAKWVAAKRKMLICANKLGQSFEPDLVDTFTNVTFVTRWLAITETPKHPNPQNMFLVEFFDTLTLSAFINSRKKYYTNFQELFRRAYILNNTMSAEPGYKAFIEAITNKLKQTGVIIGLYSAISADKTFLAAMALKDHVKEAMQTADSQVENSNLVDNYYDQWASVIDQLFTIEFGYFVKYHLVEIIIFATKAKDILACHSMGTVMAWTRAMDSRYITGTSPYRPALPSGSEYAPEPDEVAALSEYGGGADDGELVDDGDTRYRTLILTGTDLNVWATVNGKEYQLFENGKLVEYDAESVDFPFVYNIDFDLQKCVWLDATSEQKFRVVTPEATDFRCVERRLDTTKDEPTAVYVFDNMPDVFPESFTYEITMDEDHLYVNEPYGDDQFNFTSISGNYYHEGEEGSGDKTMYYTIGTSVEPEGVAALCGGGYSKRGERTLLMTFTDQDYEFDYWTLDGERVASDDPHTEISTYTDEDGTVIPVPLYQVLVDADHDVVAHYKKKGTDGGADGGDDSGDKGDGDSGGGSGDGDGSGDENGGGSTDGYGARRTSDDPMPQTGDGLGDAAKLAAGAAALAGAAAVATHAASAGDSEN